MPVLQIGMDTPQVSVNLLDFAADELRSGAAALLGPAFDGGWWALGLADPAHADVLREVPMSTADTCARTGAALAGAGLEIGVLLTLSDADTMREARAVAAVAPHGRFGRTVRAVAAAPAEKAFS